MRHIKAVTKREIEKLWGFSFALPPSQIGKQLYLIVKKNGEPHKQGGGRYITENEVKPTDIQL